MRPGQPNISPQRQARILKAVDLKLKGKSYRAIADDLGVSVSVAFDDVWHHFSEVDKLATEKLEQIRKLEVARLDRMLERLTGIIEREGFRIDLTVVEMMKTAEAPAEFLQGLADAGVDLDETAIKAIGTATKLMERRAKLLGLDAPTKTQAVEPEPVDDEDLLAQLAEAKAKVEARLAEKAQANGKVH